MIDGSLFLDGLERETEGSGQVGPLVWMARAITSNSKQFGAHCVSLRRPQTCMVGWFAFASLEPSIRERPKFSWHTSIMRSCHLLLGLSVGTWVGHPNFRQQWGGHSRGCVGYVRDLGAHSNFPCPLGNKSLCPGLMCMCVYVCARLLS